MKTRYKILIGIAVTLTLVYGPNLLAVHLAL